MMDMAATIILFAEMPGLQWHYDYVIESLYMTATCQFRLYIFFHWDFVVPLFSLLFDPVAPFLAISLHMAHPIPPHQVQPPVAPPRPAHPASSESKPSEMVDSSSSSSSSGPDDDYAPADSGMAIGFLSLESV